ncbi:MAG: AMP-binding protein, partial [Pseudomonadota bacterium]|nr:AMP-binding protein [Pseudomonadota bacterium]
AKLFLADRAFAETIGPALKLMKSAPALVEIDDPAADSGSCLGGVAYDAFIAGGDPVFIPPGPQDEWDSICLLYTSGTTGNPKGALYTHRGAFLGALSNAFTFGLDHNSVYLWTLPMFHCSGWTYTWGVTAAAAAHVCLRKVEPRAVFDAIAANGVTHMCGAPIVLNMLAHAPAADRMPLPGRVKVATGGAAPPSSVIARMEEMGFEVLHLYGATETYGPSTFCAPQGEWETQGEQQRHSLMARQGIPTVLIGAMMIADPLTLLPVPKDGVTIGELMVRGNTVMKGYLKNPKATGQALEGDWYRSGDLGVWHADGYIEIKDRSKDIIISGGENISSLEVEEILYRHPDIMEAAVVAKPDAKWGETPCAFVTPKHGARGLTAEAVMAFCRDNLARFKCPRHVVFGPLPKTSTGKIQKFVLRELARQADSGGENTAA